MFKHLVNRKKIEWIAYNYELSSHARERIKERYGETRTIKDAILNSCLSWYYQNDIIAIAINANDIFYVGLKKMKGSKEEKATIITFTWESKTGNNVVDKFCKNYLEKKKEDKIKFLEEE